MGRLVCVIALLFAWLLATPAGVHASAAGCHAEAVGFVTAGGPVDGPAVATLAARAETDEDGAEDGPAHAAEPRTFVQLRPAGKMRVRHAMQLGAVCRPGPNPEQPRGPPSRRG